MKVSGPAYLWNSHLGASLPHSGPSSPHSGPSAPHSGLDPESPRSFQDAFNIVRAELSSLANGTESADVYAAHLAMLDDPMLREAVEANIAAGISDREAVDAACESICAMFSEIDDEYLRARVDDVRDIFRRLKDAMCGAGKERGVPFGGQLSRSRQVLRFAEDAGCENGRGPRGAQRADTTSAAKPVVVAEELFPSDLAGIDLGRIAGILCHRGSATSHVGIIAHSHGIPIQFGVDIASIAGGDIVTVDDPMVGPSAIATQVRAAGRKVYVNAGSIEDIRAAIAAGADGIGVFRTEFLFMDRASMPSREEQRVLYRDALEICAGKPLIIRLLDVGGDKALPYLPMPREDNPYLGLRGVRFGLAHPEIYETQIGAIVDAALDVPGSRPRIMIPMVCTVEEVRRVREILHVILSGAKDLPLGIMVETPAAVLDAEALASECDFFSLGTNDLTQYIMAADRGNASVGELYDPMSPAVRRAIELTVSAAHSSTRRSVILSDSEESSGIPVSICGELASDPRATSFLLEAGLDSLSLSHL